MPITKSAKKTLKSSKAKRVFNLMRSATLKDKVKELGKLVDAKDKSGAEKLLPEVYKAIDKAAKRGIIKKNTAARKKSGVARLVREI